MLVLAHLFKCIFQISKWPNKKQKNKNYCTTCHEKHIPLTGKKCKLTKKTDMDLPSTSGAHLMSSSSESDVPDFGVGTSHTNMSAKKEITKQKDCSVKKAVTSGQSRPSDQFAETSSEEHSSGALQALILQQLQQVNSSHDAVEDYSYERAENKDNLKLSTPQCLVKSSHKSKKCKKSKIRQYSHHQMMKVCHHCYC